jgi:hypothetical protein
MRIEGLAVDGTLTLATDLVQVLVNRDVEQARISPRVGLAARRCCRADLAVDLGQNMRLLADQPLFCRPFTFSRRVPISSLRSAVALSATMALIVTNSYLCHSHEDLPPVTAEVSPHGTSLTRTTDRGAHR